jgi:parallel beta-helix repeat protein
MISLGSYHAAGLALALGSTLQAATYEVAQQNPHASDDGPGTAARPWKTFAKAAEKAGPGDVVVIRDGVYRERVLAKTSGTAQAPIRFEAAPGEHVVLTGADRLTGWRKADEARPIYSTTWPHKFIGWNRSMTHPDDEYHRIIGRCEQVAVNGYLLRQVLTAGQLAPGAFFVNVTNQALLVWDPGSRDLNKTHVEASVRQEVLRVEGDYVQVRGLRFRYAANMAQHGAVVLAGRYDTMEDCVVEVMNASGATFAGEDAIVRRCVFRDNGQLGFGASRAHRLLFTECLVENNNTKGFDRGWEAGGNKLVLCRDAVLERSRFVRNRGNGIWFDIGNTNCTVRQCLIADNEDAGIFYEISFGLHAQDNVIVGNGFAATAGAWGAQAGISLSSSPGCTIERNVIAGNREGFNFREQTRTTPTIGDRSERPVWNHDQLIRHNLIVLNRDAQVWGWFDMKNNRHWPATRAPTSQAEAAVTARPEDIAGAYAAKTSESQPQGLTLEKLRLRLEKNVYFAAPGQGWFKWGTTWARHRSYAGLREFESELGIDAESQVLDPGFADVRQLDFRLRTEAMSLVEESYPRGPVPGVILGLRQ